MVSHGGVDREDVDYRTTQGVCAQPRPTTNTASLSILCLSFMLSFSHVHTFVFVAGV